MNLKRRESDYKGDLVTQTPVGLMFSSLASRERQTKLSAIGLNLEMRSITMSRWKIEKDGTGIEKSGTGIEKSGTGIEKSGTGIEKSGTGIEKSGTGIEKSGTGMRRVLFACAIATFSFACGVQADAQDPAGSLQLVVNRNSVAVSWIIDGSVFSGIAPLSGSYSTIMLTEIALSDQEPGLDVTGNGTGSSLQVTGNGTGSPTQAARSGSENSKQVTGNGTGGSTQVTGNGTGSSTNVTGNGTGISIQVTGNGTGSSTQVTGNGSGSSFQITGNGTGTDAISVTLPDGTGLAMEVSLGCGSADVTVLDSAFAPVATFSRVPIIGHEGFCTRQTDEFKTDPGRDFRTR